MSVPGEHASKIQEALVHKSVANKQGINVALHGFMKLPPEVRIMIFELCLLKGTIYVPKGAFTSLVKYEKKYTMDAKLYWSRMECYRDLPEDWGELYARGQRISLICGVSKQIQIEASSVFYGRNQFVFPYGNWEIPIPRAFQFNHDIHSQIRDISISFDMRDFDKIRYEFMYEQDFTLDSRGNVKNKTDYWQEYHDIEGRRVARAWHDRLLHVIAMHKIERLQLRLDQCYCPIGCCRWIDTVFSILKPPCRHFRYPRNIEVMGWRNEDEKKYIESELRGIFYPRLASPQQRPPWETEHYENTKVMWWTDGLDPPVNITFVGEGMELDH